jgi:integrase
LNRPQFRFNTTAKVALAQGKRPRKEAPTWGSWLHVYWDASNKKRRLVCETCTTATVAAAHNLEVAQEAKAKKGGGTTWEEVWASFLAVREGAPNLPALKSMGRTWLSPVLAGKAVRGITPADCLTVLLRAEREGLAASTQRLLYATGKAAYQHALDVLEVAERNPWAKVKPPKVHKVKRPALSTEQAERILEGAGENRLLLLTAILTGVRRGELAGMKWADIKWQDGEAGVLVVSRSWDRATTKGGAAREVPLHPVLREGLLAALSTATGELVFPSPTTGGMRSKTWHAADMLRLVAERAGVELPQGITFHSLRRTFATLVHDASKDRLAVQRLLGHTDAKVTDIYLAHSLPQLERAVAQVSLFNASPEADAAGEAAQLQRAG